MRCSWASSLGFTALAVVCASGTARPMGAQTPAPAPATASATTSAAAAKDLVAALKAAKLDAFAVKDPAQPGRFVAVLHMPNLQLLLVAATYERMSDIEYRIYKKDYQGAYSDLYSGVLSSNRMMIEDMLCDGLVAIPAKGQPLIDSVNIQTAKHAFDGDIADPKKKGDKRITREAYMKVFAEADEEYQHLLAMLISGLRSGSVLGPERLLR